MDTSVLDHALRCALVTIAGESRARMRAAVALSGGRDSMALLDAAHRVAPTVGVALSAVHVHHGLSRNADAWAAFCRAQCARRDLPLTVICTTPTRGGGESLEAVARDARYRALASTGADAVLLAHHADDQAETLLLQLMRGAGPHGVAAMRPYSGARPCWVRPWLDVPSAVIAAYAAAHALDWIDDESNEDVRLRRNALRHRVSPVLRTIFPGYPKTVVRAARHQREAVELLDELAALDAASATAPQTPLALDRAAFATLAGTSPPRARNLLRWFLRQHGLPAPHEERLRAIVQQCVEAREDGRVQVRHAGATIALHRAHIVVHRASDTSAFSATWTGESALQLPGGVLEMQPTCGRGIAVATLASGPLIVRPRRGGERLRVAPTQPRRSVSELFRASGTPWWLRAGWPLVWQGESLVAVPGIAVDARFAAALDAPGYALRWRPDA